MQISQKLTELRNKRRLTVKEVSLQLNIPESTYRGYEYGAKLPADLLPGVCEVFNISLESFFTEDSHKLNSNEALKALLSIENYIQDIRDYINLTNSNF